MKGPPEWPREVHRSGFEMGLPECPREGCSRTCCRRSSCIERAAGHLGAGESDAGHLDVVERDAGDLNAVETCCMPVGARPRARPCCRPPCLSRGRDLAVLSLGANDERDEGVVGDSDRVTGDLREPKILLGVRGEWPEPKISCDSEVNGLSPKFRCAYLCCATPPHAPRPGPHTPRETEGGRGERRGRDPRPREPGPSGAETPGRKVGGGGACTTRPKQTCCRFPA